MAIQSYILATGQAAEAAALLPGADQPSIGSIEFGAGHTLSDASTVGLETPLAPPQSTTQINYATPVGGEAKLGYQVGGSAEFNFSEILLRLDDAATTAYARIVDTVGDLNGKNASQILVGLLNVNYTNPPQASGLVATTAAPLAMLMASEDNAGAVELATDAEFLAGNANRVPTAAKLVGSAQIPKTAGAGVRLDSLIADGFANIPAAVMATAPDKPADAAAGEAVVHRQNNHWQLIDGAGNIYAKVGAGAWARASGKPPDVQKWTVAGNYQWQKPDGASQVIIELKASGFGEGGGGRGPGAGVVGRARNRTTPNGYVVIDIPADYLPSVCAVVVPAGGAGGAASASSFYGAEGAAGSLASFNGWTADLAYALGKSSVARGGFGGGDTDGTGNTVTSQPGQDSPLPLIFGKGGNSGGPGAPNGQPGTAPSGNGGAGYGPTGRGGDGAPGEVRVTTHFL